MPLSNKWEIAQDIYKTVKTYPAPVEKIMIAIDTHGTEYIFTGYEPNGKIRAQHPNGLNCTVPENRYKLKSVLPNHILKGHYHNYTAGGKFVS